MVEKAKIRMVSDGWTWFADYAFAYTIFTINVPVGREVEVGTGISFQGRPRGARHRVRRHKKIITFGLGAVHVRVIDGRGLCKVRVDQGAAGLIPIIDTTF